MKNIDLYSGFEGEPELVFFVEDKTGHIYLKLKIWIGFFDKILEKIKPESNGAWEGVPFFYHTQTGWYDEENWRCEYVELFKEQLARIDTDSLDVSTKKAFDSLFNILSESLRLNLELYFNYE